MGGWRQYKNIDIRFHDKITILTGANGAGKTTLINILNKHFGWERNLLSIPSRNKSGGPMEYLSGIFSFLKKVNPETSTQTIGEILYSDGSIAEIDIPKNVNRVFSLQITKRKDVTGLHIPSHRPVYKNQPLDQIPFELPKKEVLFRRYSDEIRNIHTAQGHSGISPNKFIKEALVVLALYGYGSEKITPDLEAKATFQGFVDVLKAVLPPSLGFQDIRIEPPEVVIETKGGPFPFDEVSGGITAIIDLAWQIYTFSIGKEEDFVVTIDEPENHLHPALQRQLLPSFVKAFPRAQFIIATHNPFIIGSVPDSNVYALKYDEENKVESVSLDMKDKTGSTATILRDILGLESTLPIWVEDKFKEIFSKYNEADFTSENLNSMREELKEYGLENLAPELILKIDKKDHDPVK